MFNQKSPSLCTTQMLSPRSPYYSPITGHTFRRPSRLHTVNPSHITPPIPKLNLHENPEKNLITATLDLPGITKENIQLTILNNTLIVSAKTSSSSHNERGYVIRERYSGKLSRLIKLPQGITEEDITASMADGVLTITYPRSSPKQEPKKIPIA